MTPIEDVEVRVGQLEIQSENMGKAIDELKADVKAITKSNESIHEIATSIQLMAKDMSNIDKKVDNLDNKVSTMDTKISEVDHRAEKETAKRMQNLKTALLTAACTAVITWIVTQVIAALLHSPV